MKLLQEFPPFSVVGGPSAFFLPPSATLLFGRPGKCGAGYGFRGGQAVGPRFDLLYASALKIACLDMAQRVLVGLKAAFVGQTGVDEDRIGAVLVFCDQLPSRNGKLIR